MPQDGPARAPRVTAGPPARPMRPMRPARACPEMAGNSWPRSSLSTSGTGQTILNLSMKKIPLGASTTARPPRPRRRARAPGLTGRRRDDGQGQDGEQRHGDTNHRERLSAPPTRRARACAAPCRSGGRRRPALQRGRFAAGGGSSTPHVGPRRRRRPHVAAIGQGHTPRRACLAHRARYGADSGWGLLHHRRRQAFAPSARHLHLQLPPKPGAAARVERVKLLAALPLAPPAPDHA